PSMRFLAMGILISSSLVGGFTLAKQSSNLAGVCELLGNCANNQQLEAIAQETATKPIPSLKDTSEASQLKPRTEIQNFPAPFVESPQSDSTESLEGQAELLEKVQSLQSQVARLLERNDSRQSEAVEKKEPKNAVEKKLERATAPQPSTSPSPSSDRTLSEKLLDGARSILTVEKKQPIPVQPQPTRSPAQSEPTPAKQAQTPAPESNRPTAQKPQSQTPAPQTKNPPAQTYQPGFWQPVARINPKHPFKIKLVNQTNAAIEYALTTNEFSPRKLSSKESAILTYVPLDGYLLINSTQTSPNEEVPTSLQFEVTVSGNIATVSIRQEKSDRPADSTINVNQSGAIYIF
ncbi:MAG: hypothetical protein HC777_00075, partial [Hyphomonadaceae bacterium]|nr:hypothetical protein [Hyphomonadaceae bacterium]